MEYLFDVCREQDGKQKRFILWFNKNSRNFLK